MMTGCDSAVSDLHLVQDGTVLQASIEGEPQWIELRDALGKLQGKWNPDAGVLEIQRRGVKTRYRLESRDRP